MTPDQIFDLSNSVAFATWVMLALSPWIPHALTTARAVVPAVLAALYAVLIAANWAGSEGGFSSLADVAALFSNPWLLLAGWVHYLAFDLLVGTWEVSDARSRGVPHLLVVPCLALTFLFGPAGWLLYMVLRGTKAGDRRVQQVQ
jgi:hypothetical protein